MMMPIGRLELLHCHSKETGSIPQIDAVLHEPGRTGVAQNVRGHINTKARSLDRSFKPLAHALDWRAIPFDHSLAR